MSSFIADLYQNLYLDKKININDNDTFIHQPYKQLKYLKTTFHYTANEDLFIELHIQPNILYKYDINAVSNDIIYDNTISNQLHINIDDIEIIQGDCTNQTDTTYTDLTCQDGTRISTDPNIRIDCTCIRPDVTNIVFMDCTVIEGIQKGGSPTTCGPDVTITSDAFGDDSDLLLMTYDDNIDDIENRYTFTCKNSSGSETTPSYGAGKFNKSLYLYYTYLESLPFNALNFSNEFTISLQINPDYKSSTHCLFHLSDSNTNHLDLVTIKFDASNTYFLMPVNGNDETFTFNLSPTLNTQQHQAFVINYDSSTNETTVTFYNDMTVIDKISKTGMPDLTSTDNRMLRLYVWEHLVIGNRQNYYYGYADQLRIFNRPLNNKEIYYLYVEGNLPDKELEPDFFNDNKDLILITFNNNFRNYSNNTLFDYLVQGDVKDPNNATWINGILNNAIYFNKNRDSYNVECIEGFDDILNGNNLNFAITYWLNAKTWDNLQTVTNYQGDTDYFSIQYMYDTVSNSNYHRVKVKTNSNNIRTLDFLDTTITENKQQFFVFNFKCDGTNTYITSYIDGTAIETQTITNEILDFSRGASVDTYYNIGAYYNEIEALYVEGLCGYIDQYRLFERTLTDKEILALYYEKTPDWCIDEGDLRYEDCTCLSGCKPHYNDLTCQGGHLISEDPNIRVDCTCIRPDSTQEYIDCTVIEDDITETITEIINLENISDIFDDNSNELLLRFNNSLEDNDSRYTFNQRPYGSPSYNSGKFYEALHIPDENFIEAGDIPILTSGEENFTISLWINPSSLTSSYEMLFRYISEGETSEEYIQLMINENTVRLDLNDSDITIVFDATIPTNEQTHLVIDTTAVSGETQRTYSTLQLNNIKIDTKYDTGLAAFSSTGYKTIQIGAKEENENIEYKYSGDIDQYRIFNRNTNDEEVNILYNEQKSNIIRTVYKNCTCLDGCIHIDTTCHTECHDTTQSLTSIVDIQNDNDCIGLWRFDNSLEEENSTYKIYDNSKDLTYTTGQFNTALDFGTTGDEYVTYEDLPYYNTMAFSFWVYKHQNNSSFQSFISFADNGTSNRILILEDMSPLNTIGVEINDNRYDLTVPTTDTSRWYHFVFNVGQNLECYVDGTLVDSMTAEAIDTSYSGNNRFVLAQDQDSVGGGFSSTQSLLGKIDQLRIYNRALTQDEINTLYTETTTVLDCTEICVDSTTYLCDGTELCQDSSCVPVDITNILSSKYDIIYPIFSFKDTYIYDTNTMEFLDTTDLFLLYIQNGKLILEGHNNNKLIINLDSTEHGINLFDEKFVSNLQRILIGKHGKTTYMALYLISDEKVLLYTDTTEDIFPQVSNDFEVYFGYLKRFQPGHYTYTDCMGGWLWYVIFDHNATSYPFVQHQEYKNNRLSKAEKYGNYYVYKFNIENSKFANLDIHPLYLNVANTISENNILKLNPEEDSIQKIDEQEPTVYDSTTHSFYNFDIIPATTKYQRVKFNLHDITNGYSMLSYDYKNIFATNHPDLPFNVNYISNKSINGQKDEALCIYEIYNKKTTIKKIYFVPIWERGSYYIDQTNGTYVKVDTTYTCKDFTSNFETETPIIVGDLDIDSTYYYNDSTELNITQFQPELYDENLKHHEMTQKTAYKLKYYILGTDTTNGWEFKTYGFNYDNTELIDLSPFGNEIELDSTIITNIKDHSNLYRTLKSMILKVEPNFYNDCKYVSGITENGHIVNLPYDYYYSILNWNYKILLNPDSTVKLPPIDFIISKRIWNTKLDYGTSPYIVSTNNIDKHVIAEITRKNKINNLYNVNNISNIVGLNVNDLTQFIYIQYNLLDINNNINDSTLIIKPLYITEPYSIYKLNEYMSEESNLLNYDNIIFNNSQNNINCIITAYYLCSRYQYEDLFCKFDIPYTFINKFITEQLSNNTLMLTLDEKNNVYKYIMGVPSTITWLSPIDIFKLTKTKFETIKKLDIFAMSYGLMGLQEFDGNVNEYNNLYNTTLNGTATFTDGVFGQAVDLGNTQQTTNYIRIDNIKVTPNMSFSFWLYKHQKNTSLDTYFSLADSNTSNRILISTWYNNGKEYLNIYINNIVIRKESNIFTDLSSQNHFVINVGEEISVYKNGKLVEKINGLPLNTSYSNNNVLILGQEQDSVGGGFDSNQCLMGKIDQLRIYNRTLTEQDAQMLYNENPKLYKTSNYIDRFVYKLTYKYTNYSTNNPDYYVNGLYYPTNNTENDNPNDINATIHYPIDIMSYNGNIQNIYMKFDVIYLANTNKFKLDI